MAKERYPLQQVIRDDLVNHNKCALLLLLVLVATAVGTIWVTHQTRLTMAEKGLLADENMRLENRYINLLMEENSLSQKERVEDVAKLLKLGKVSKEQEIILIQKP